MMHPTLPSLPKTTRGLLSAMFFMLLASFGFGQNPEQPEQHSSNDALAENLIDDNYLWNAYDNSEPIPLITPSLMLTCSGNPTSTGWNNVNINITSLAAAITGGCTNIASYGTGSAIYTNNYATKTVTGLPGSTVTVTTGYSGMGTRWISIWLAPIATSDFVFYVNNLSSGGAGTSVNTFTAPATFGTYIMRVLSCGGNAATSCSAGNIGTYVDVKLILESNNSTTTAGAIGSAQTICNGGTPALLTNTTSGTGTGTLTYEWQKDAVTISGAVAATYQPPALAATAVYKRRTKVVNTCGTFYSAYTATVTITVVADPVAKSVTSSPVTGSTICIGGGSNATFSGGSGGAGTITDIYEYSTNGGGSWAAYTGGTNVNAPTSGTTMQYRTRRTATGLGCDATANNTASITVVADPVAQSVTSTPVTGSTICIGGGSSATFSGGSGGTGTITDTYENSTNGGGSWSAYTGGTNVNAPTSGTTVQYRTRRTATGIGCDATANNTASITVVADPVAQSVTSTPVTGSTICLGGGSSATFSGGSGGTGTITDTYENSTNGGGSWSAYTGGTNVNAPTSGTTVQYRTRRTATGIGCDATANNTASITVVADPVAQSVTSTPASGSTICIGGGSSATFSGGSGGTGTITDTYENSTNGGGSWAAYIGGTNVNAPTSGTTVQYRTRRTATGTGCDATANNTASINVNDQPAASTVTGTPPSGSSLCIGISASATFSGASGGAGTITDEYEYSTDGGGSWAAYTGGSPAYSNRSGNGTLQIRTRRTATASGCTNSSYNTATYIVTGPSATTPTALATNDYVWSGSSGNGTWDATTNNWSKYDGSIFAVPVTAPASTDNVYLRAYSCGTTTAINSAIACNNLRVEEGMTLNLSGTNTFTVNGNLTNVGTIAVTSGTPAIAVKKDYTNTGSFNLASGSVAFNGSTAQTIAGNTLQNVTFVNTTTGSADININQPLSINGAATFTDSVVYYTGTGSLTFAAGASSNGGSATSFVDGPIIKTGSTDFVFPTGKDDVWARIAVTSISAPETFTARYNSGNHGLGIAKVSPLTNVSTLEYWDLDRAGSSSAKVTLYWENATRSQIDNCTDLTVAHWDGTSQWDEKAGTASGSCVPAGAGSVTTNVAVTTFSPFAFGARGAGNPLPIELLSFEANCINGKTEVEWSTASETNNSFFTLEKATNEMVFIPIGKIKSSGNSSTIQNYSFFDKSPITKEMNRDGINYYRLKQTDLNGAFSYSGIIYTSCNNLVFENINVYPNPVSGRLNCDIFSKENIIVNISITDLLGRNVVLEKVNLSKGENHTLIDISKLSPAPYYFKLEAMEGDIKDCKQILVK